MATIRTILVGSLLATLVVASPAAARPTGPTITHGVVVGDVRADSAVLWGTQQRAG